MSKIKTRLLDAQDIINLENSGYAQTDPQKRQVRKDIFTPTETAQLNIMIKMLLILAKFHLGESVSNEELSTLNDNLTILEDYKQRLRDKELEALTNVPNDIKYYMDKEQK